MSVLSVRIPDTFVKINGIDKAVEKQNDEMETVKSNLAGVTTNLGNTNQRITTAEDTITKIVQNGITWMKPADGWFNFSEGPPPDPQVGMRYINYWWNPPAGSSWHYNSVYEFTGDVDSPWAEFLPHEGSMIFARDDDIVYVFFPSLFMGEIWYDWQPIFHGLSHNTLPEAVGRLTHDDIDAHIRNTAIHVSHQQFVSWSDVAWIWQPGFSCSLRYRLNVDSTATVVFFNSYGTSFTIPAGGPYSVLSETLLPTSLRPRFTVYSQITVHVNGKPKVLPLLIYDSGKMEIHGLTAAETLSLPYVAPVTYLLDM